MTGNGGSRSRNVGATNVTAKSSTLFVRGLPLDTTNDELVDHFSLFAAVQHAFVVKANARGRGGKQTKGSGAESGNRRTISGFVRFASIGDACECLSRFPKGRGRDPKTLFRGQHRLRVEEAISKGMPESDRKEAVKGRKKRKRGEDFRPDPSAPGWSEDHGAKKKKRTREEVLAAAAAKSRALRERSKGLNQL